MNLFLWKTASYFILIGFLTTFGCQGQNNLPTLHVEGVVTLDGSPVDGATVTFLPADPSTGIAATGMTNAQGAYTLTSVKGRDEMMPTPGGGALPGEYLVTIRKVEVIEPMSEQEAEEQGVKFTALTPGREPKPTYLVPKIYSQPKKTDLKANVSEGSKEHSFALKS